MSSFGKTKLLELVLVFVKVVNVYEANEITKTTVLIT
jgi:hypothetical protein